MPMVNTLYLPELRQMLAADDVAGLREFGDALHPARAAEFMEGLAPAEAWQVLQAVDASRRTEIFGYLDEAMRVSIVESVEPSMITPLVADLAADDRVDLVNEVHPDVVEQLMPFLPDVERRELERLRTYPEGTAGAVMTTEVARLSESLTVREALEEISRQAEGLETVYYNYIVDEHNHLRGLISARQLVTHFRQPNLPISELMQRNVVTVLATDDQETVAAKVASYDFLAIPVLDDEQHLLGIITHDDIIDVLREEATEDAHMAAGVNPLDDGYLETHWATLAYKRGVWLTILFIAGFLTVQALSSYDEQLTRVSWLGWFVPLVIASGGNSGSQSATLVITALTNGEVHIDDWWRVAKREILMGLCLGGLLAIGGYIGVRVMAPDVSVGDALVVPITQISVVLFGTMIGGLLPLLFRRLGLDPALMSNPFVTGIIDVSGILIYMNVARLFLHEVL
jgi:magnesium transporter